MSKLRPQLHTIWQFLANLMYLCPNCFHNCIRFGNFVSNLGICGKVAPTIADSMGSLLAAPTIAHNFAILWQVWGFVLKLPPQLHTIWQFCQCHNGPHNCTQFGNLFGKFGELCQSCPRNCKEFGNFVLIENICGKVAATIAHNFATCFQI